VIVVDTEPIVDLLNDRDDHHERCRDFLANHPGPLLVPTTVFAEVCMLALAERRRGTRAELAFLADVRAGLFTRLETTSADLDRIADLVETYADLPLARSTRQ
jgi:predicted nucleic acid-binding protein